MAQLIRVVGKEFHRTDADSSLVQYFFQNFSQSLTHFIIYEFYVHTDR